MPQAVQQIADQILNRIPDNRRIKKQWASRPEGGSVDHITSIEDVPLHEGDWLILARTNDKLIKLKSILKEMAIYFEIKGRKSYKTRLYTAVKHYTRWTNGDKLSLSECKDLFEFLELEQELKEERMYDLKNLIIVLKTNGMRFLNLIQKNVYTLEKCCETKKNYQNQQE